MEQLPQAQGTEHPLPQSQSLYQRHGVQSRSCHVLAVRPLLPSLEGGHVYPSGT